MNTCLSCKYFNKKKVIQPKGSGMCENLKSENHKSVVSEGCKLFKEGKFRVEFVSYPKK